MFRLGVNNTGKTNVVEYEKIKKEIKEIEEMGQEMLFEVFCDKYTDAYVRQAFCNDKIDTMTIEQVQVSLNYFKMEYHDKTGKLITTTPDKVFNKMLHYLPNLPNDAVKWIFCLPIIYYNSLSSKVRNQIAVDKYILPQISLLTTKEDQLPSMTVCRAWAVKALTQIKLVEDNVQSLISKEITGLRVSGNFVQPMHQQLQVLFQQPPQLPPHQPPQQPPHQPPVSSINAYTNSSRVEDMMRREQYKKKRDMDCPSGFVQKFVMSNGLQYPCHPEDVSKHSQFPLDFPVCFGYGSEQHGFSDCPTTRENSCYKNSHWNLHCHKHGIFFRNRSKKAGSFKA